MKAELEQSILCENITCFDSTIECHIEIRSRIARKWLNRLGYK